ncbi:putative chemotaxis phosphatase, CheX [Desulfovibrio sp. X2]|uniref:chemotaxis protein CheX n=1 Tax=Desulfovibrio sp. X2 TaxID=941449 RepID=UPI0003589918|nr:chemotaxis protein CheX [Desulfovibrio sp. X2]EPR43788.1 putative chemotaxis phosphatase, CheX [Desulfovibrio sp. X2]
MRYDVNFINPFLSAVLNVLATMAQVVALPGKPYINTKGLAVGDVTGLIGVTGYTTGTISVTLSKGAILAIVNNMLMESYTDINADIADAVGELTNMIAGQARAKLSEQGMSFSASTPSVVVGMGHKIQHVAKAPILAIPFTTDHGNLVIEVCFADPEPDGAKPAAPAADAAAAPASESAPEQAAEQSPKDA